MLARALERLTVTVVDDEPAARDVLVRAARSWDFSCQAAASAEEAIGLLEERPTPVVVTDLRMPGRGGLWLVREVQRRWPDASVIVVTAGQEHTHERPVSGALCQRVDDAEALNPGSEGGHSQRITHARSRAQDELSARQVHGYFST